MKQESVVQLHRASVICVLPEVAKTFHLKNWKERKLQERINLYCFVTGNVYWMDLPSCLPTSFPRKLL